MSRLKIKLHETNSTLGDRYAEGTKQYLIPRIIKALDAIQASGDLDGDARDARDARTCHRIANKLKRIPEIKDALDWWFDALVSVYLKEDA